MKPLTKKDIKKLVDDGTLMMLHKVKDKHLIEGIKNLLKPKAKMKTITKDLRSVIFQQYHSQYVNSSIGLCRLRDSDRVDEIEWIELKKLSNITDEDKQILVDRFGISKRYFEECLDALPNYQFFEACQILQSLGFALPYKDYSVEDLVKLGIYKLK